MIAFFIVTISIIVSAKSSGALHVDGQSWPDLNFQYIKGYFFVVRTIHLSLWVISFHWWEVASSFLYIYLSQALKQKEVRLQLSDFQRNRNYIKNVRYSRCFVILMQTLNILFCVKVIGKEHVRIKIHKRVIHMNASHRKWDTRQCRNSNM